MLRIGAVVGERYRVLSQIGEGGMGRVYLAEDLRLKGQRWAVKWLPKDGMDPRQAEKEAQIMTSLKHPSLPRIVDTFQDEAGGGSCLVMDYIEGETLLQRSNAHDHRLPWTSVVHYALQLCDLLDYLHSLDSPIVFRDMKPSNVIVGPDDQVRLIDFGIARTYKAGKAADTMHVGSIGFAAPELLANKQTDHRADLYSLGCLLYFLLSGGQYYNFTKTPLEQINDRLPPVITAVVSKLLSEAPEQRYPHAKAVKEALERKEGNDQGVRGEQRNTGAGRRIVVTVYGLFPKAGATFVAVTLAKLLAERKRQAAYVEFPWQERDSFLTMTATAQGYSSAWREGTLMWRLGDSNDSSYDPAALYKLLFETKAETIIFDLSSNAHPEAAEALLHASDMIVPVASPDPGGLRSEATVANWAKVNASAEPDRIYWIANRMPESLKLPQFYKLFSTKPVSTIQEFSYDAVMAAKWNGGWIADEGEYKGALRAAMMPLLRAISPDIDASRGLRSVAKEWLANKWANGYNKGNN